MQQYYPPSNLTAALGYSQYYMNQRSATYIQNNLKDNPVTGDNIADNTITADKLNVSAMVPGAATRYQFLSIDLATNDIFYKSYFDFKVNSAGYLSLYSTEVLAGANGTSFFEIANADPAILFQVLDYGSIVLNNIKGTTNCITANSFISNGGAAALRQVFSVDQNGQISFGFSGDGTVNKNEIGYIGQFNFTLNNGPNIPIGVNSVYMQGISSAPSAILSAQNSFVGVSQGYNATAPTDNPYTPCSLAVRSVASTYDSVFDFYYAAVGDAAIQTAGHVQTDGSIQVYSDKRLKSHIGAVPGNTLADLLATQFYTYQLQDNPRQQVGLIAQEIVDKFPHMTNCRPHVDGTVCGKVDCFCSRNSEKILTLDYARFGVYVGKALKQFVTEVYEPERAAQQARISQLESEVAELKELVKQLINKQ